MEMKINSPLYFFEEISKIPRASCKEEKIAKYLSDFAKEHGLFCRVDAHFNVLIKRPAADGREDEPPVLLQAHTDMVTEQNAGNGHDFEKDGISLVYEGDILHADGTTLGADDGFGVAIMLSVLADDTLSAPALECLFTSAEEIGLVGASRFDYSDITARRMINLDSAEEELVITGCCGGMRQNLEFLMQKEPASGACFKLSLGGLCGGHSGEDIHRGRLNAHVLTGKILQKIKAVTALRLVRLSGGDKDNAIPRECEVIFVASDGGAVQKSMQSLTAFAKGEIKTAEDAGLTVTFKEEACPTLAFTEKDTETLLSVLELPNGVIEWKNGSAGKIPFLSRNLAKIRTKEQGTSTAVSFGFSTRSPKTEKIDMLCASLAAFVEERGGTARAFSPYCGWESDADSEIVKDWQKAYLAVTGKECRPTVIHAGLECGVISGALHGMSAVSVGCNIYDLHTPRERMEISSLARIGACVKEFLRIC